MDQYNEVSRPKHYNSHPSGIEPRHIARYFSFNIGSAFKYLWRYELKARPLQDLEKALNYVDDQIENFKPLVTADTSKQRYRHEIFILIHRVRAHSDKIVGGALWSLYLWDISGQPVHGIMARQQIVQLITIQKGKQTHARKTRARKKFSSRS